MYKCANIGGIWMGSMLPYIAAPWILWGMEAISQTRGKKHGKDTK